MTGTEATLAVITVLEALEIDYMVVGSYSSNVYGVARSTFDADLVIALGFHSVRDIADRLGPEFRFDPQSTFESVTMTTRYNLELINTPFHIELFLVKDDDPHDQERFRRRQWHPFFGRNVYLPTPEDVIITKLRWAMQAGRGKDREDVRDVIAVQENNLDWNYIHHWTAVHGSRELLDEIRVSIPPI